MEKAEEQFI